MAEHKEHHAHHTHKQNPWMYTTVIAAAVAVVVFFFPLLTSCTGSVTANIDQAADDAIGFLNDNVVQPGTEATLASVEDIGSVYEVTTDYQGQEIPIYVSKDGSFLCLQGIDMATVTTAATTVETTVPTVEKVEKPVVNAFIMSYCPYGLQFLKAYIPVMELLGDKADMSLNFVHYIMHGEQELNENTRMYCIQKEQSDLFTDYLRCFVEAGDYEGCIDSVGIDSAALDDCIAAADAEFEITKTYEESTDTYPPYMVDAVLAEAYGVRGSPSFVLNGVVTSVSRSPEAIKQVICSSFIDPPAECETVLSSTAEAAGFGPLGSGEGSTASGSC